MLNRLMQCHSLSAGLSSLPVKDLGKGSYAATLSTAAAGIVTVSATVNGEAVGLPVTVAAEPGPLASLVACSSGPLRCTAGGWRQSLLSFPHHVELVA